MAEDEGPQYALHVVITTLKDRCKSLQSTVDGLEKENMRLKMQCKRSEVPGNEVEELKERIVKLTEQKAKVRRDMVNVTNENRELWTKLSKIVQINKSLGGHLTKINDSLNQHSKRALIRSTTFTQSDADLKNVNKAITENNQISLELEDVSLKLISNIVKEKNELQAQCSEMEELQKSVNDSLGLAYFNDETEDVLTENLDQHIADLKLMKDRLNEQNKAFEKALVDTHVATLTCTCKNIVKKSSCDNVVNKNDTDDESQLQSLARWGTPENSDDFLREAAPKNCCPMCATEFPQLAMPEFVEHVENHFRLG